MGEYRGYVGKMVGGKQMANWKYAIGKYGSVTA